MKSSQKKHAQAPQEHDAPLRSKKHKLASLIIVGLLSVALLAGGVLSYFSYRGDQGFVVVDGKEVLTSSILDSLRTQLSSLNVDENQKVNYALQMLQQPLESAVWSAFATRNKLNYSPNDVQNSLRDLFETQKAEYEKENQAHFPLTYGRFLDSMQDQFNSSLVLLNGLGFVIANPLAVANTYSLNQISSVVEYQSLSLADYLLDQQLNKVAQFYESSSQKELVAKDTKMMLFSNEKLANDFYDQLEKNKDLKKTAFDKAENIRFSKNKNNDDFLFVQNVAKDQVSSPFPYRNQYAVALITNDSFLPFNDINPEKKRSIANSFVDSLKDREKKDLNTALEKLFKEGSSALIKKGKSTSINFSGSLPVMDSQTKELLTFATSENKDFYKAAFLSTGSESKMNQFKNTLYQIRVVERKDPVFPIAELEKQNISQTLLEKERNLWYLDLRNRSMDKVDVKVSFDNLKMLLKS